MVAKVKSRTSRTANKTLEGKANNGCVTATCGYCDKTLRIPKKIAQRLRAADRQFSKYSNPYLDRQYKEFYISPEGSPYCNKNHFDMFTDD